MYALGPFMYKSTVYKSGVHNKMEVAENTLQGGYSLRLHEYPSFIPLESRINDQHPLHHAAGKGLQWQLDCIICEIDEYIKQWFMYGVKTVFWFNCKICCLTPMKLLP